jgi:N-acetylmuramoyl-L-alanine amidase
MIKKKLFIFFILVLLAFIPDRHIEENEFPLYRVVIDPGHGGAFLFDKKKHGDKFDMIMAEYLDHYAEGAVYKGIYEHKLMYNIALRTIDLLSYCSKDGDFEKFKTILKKYTEGTIKKIYIDTLISRENSLTEDQIKKSDDPNAPYRLYDFPDSKGNMIKGRISKINEFRPHLVVSLHCAQTAPPEYNGMNGIIVPPYNVLKKGFLRLQTEETWKNLNDNKILQSWFRKSNRKTYKYYYYKDCAQYFTAWGITKNYQLDTTDYYGYKYNMVTWKYCDKPYWDLEAEKHADYTKYSLNFNTFRENGDFWDREKSVYEEYRRGSGFRDFGGDNYFATYEIIRYILMSLNSSSPNPKSKVPGRPYISTWSVPLLINAISTYIELGYLDRKWDREILLNRQAEIAEGVAVGVYSLLAGIDLNKTRFRHKPSGKAIDFDKYRITNEKTYFDIVSE